MIHPSRSPENISYAILDVLEKDILTPKRRRDCKARTINNARPFGLDRTRGREMQGHQLLKVQTQAQAQEVPHRNIFTRISSGKGIPVHRGRSSAIPAIERKES